MYIPIRVASFVTMRAFERCHYKVLADFEPFPGGHVKMNKQKSKKVTQFFWGEIDKVIKSKSIPEVRQGEIFPTGNFHKLGKEELEWLKEVKKLIEWGDDNKYWLEIGNKYNILDEANFQLAELQVSAI